MKDIIVHCDQTETEAEQALEKLRDVLDRGMLVCRDEKGFPLFSVLTPFEKDGVEMIREHSLFVPNASGKPSRPNQNWSTWACLHLEVQTEPKSPGESLIRVRVASESHRPRRFEYEAVSRPGWIACRHVLALPLASLPDRLSEQVRNFTGWRAHRFGKVGPPESCSIRLWIAISGFDTHASESLTDLERALALRQPDPYSFALRAGGRSLLAEVLFCNMMLGGLLDVEQTPVSDSRGHHFGQYQRTYTLRTGIDVGAVQSLEQWAAGVFENGASFGHLLAQIDEAPVADDVPQSGQAITTESPDWSAERSLEPSALQGDRHGAAILTMMDEARAIHPTPGCM